MKARTLGVLLIVWAGCTCERVVERLSPIPSPPRLDALPEITNTPQLPVTGTKQPGTSVLLQGREIVSLTDDVGFQAVVDLIEGDNLLQFSCRNAQGVESAVVVVRVTLDTIPPSPPTVLSFASPTTTPMPLLMGGKEAGAALWLNGVMIVSPDGSTQWGYWVSLIEGPNLLSFTSTDLAGNVSSPTSLTIVLAIPPSAPTGLTFTVGDGVVSLDWLDNTEPDLAGYNIYMAPSSGGPYTRWNGALLTTSAALLTGLTNGTAYYVVVTAVDTFGAESARSSEVAAVPRVPPSISSITPNRGPRASYVTISGAGFGSTQGTSTASFNGALAGTALTWSDTSITIRVPQGASSGPVRVIVQNAPSAPVTFLVMPPTGLNFVEGPWDPDTLGASLALDPSTGYPGFAYLGRWGSDTARNLYYVFWDGTSWNAQYVSTYTNYISIAKDPATGYPRIAYSDSTNGIRYAYWDGSAWISQVVDATYGQELSLKLNPLTGSPSIAYREGPAWSCGVKYAAWTGSSWTAEVVDTTGGRAGFTPSLAFDPVTGYPRVSYTNAMADAALKYASWDGSSWNIQYVEIGVAIADCSLALDPFTRNPVIACWGLLFRNNGVSWTQETYDSEPWRHVSTSLAVDPITGNPHISYMNIFYENGIDDYVSALKYAFYDGVQWQVKTIDRFTNIGYATSIALDPITRLPRIGYIDYTPDPYIKTGPTVMDLRWGTLKYYAMPAPGDMVVAEAIPRLADDKDTAVTVTGQNFGNSQGQSRLFFNAGEATVLTWTASVITALTTQSFTQSGGIEVVLGPQDGWGASNNGLKEIWLPDDAEVPNNHDGFKAQAKPGAMALDPVTEYPRILFEELYDTYSPSPYYFTYTASYKYAEWDGTSWSTETIDTPLETFTHRAGEDGWGSLQIDPLTREPRLTYTKMRGDTMWIVYAARTAGLWVTQPIINIGGWNSVFASHSLALDPVTGEPRMSWHQMWPGGLKYTYFSGGTWMTQTVDATGGSGTGIGNTLALDPVTGYPRIAYVHDGDFYLRYAQWTGTSWTTEAIEFSTPMNFGLGLALNPATGFPRISYYKQEPFGFTGLRYASWNGATWDLSTVEAIEPLSGQKVAGWTSLVLDPITGYPRIAYDNFWNINTLGLRIARWDGTQWNIHVVGMDWSAPMSSSGLRTTATGKLRCLFFYGPWRIMALWMEP